jgi:CheY-like chemotaxis protein
MAGAAPLPQASKNRRFSTRLGRYARPKLNITGQPDRQIFGGVHSIFLFANSSGTEFTFDRRPPPASNLSPTSTRFDQAIPRYENPRCNPPFLPKSGHPEQICCAGTKSSAFSNMRILIADDEKGFSVALADLVRSCGHEVVDVVHSGLDAIRSYRRCKPDVVLMDFAMARLNGLTACRNILSEDPHGCILFLSGLTERNELIPETSGALAVLEKPISRARLEQVLNDTFTRRQQAESRAHESLG